MCYEKGPILSVIIPVYNVESYLKKCVDSVVEQTLKNIEILAVDDGSTDDSGKILDEYAAKDSRIRVFHERNGGVSRARNIGLENAKGKYVAFVDSDDFLPLDIYESAVDLLEAEHCDMLQFSLFWVDEKGNVLKKMQNKTQSIDSKHFFKAYKSYIITGIVCDKVFKREKINGNRFLENLPVSEDQLFISMYLDEIDKVKILEKVGYFYYQRDNSVTHEFINSKHFSDIDLFTRFFKDGVLTKESLSGRMISIFMSKKSLSLILSMLANNIYTERYFELRNIFLDNLKDVFINRSVSFTNKVCAFMIWVCPKLFYSLYPLYHKLKIRRKNEHGK